MNIKTLVLIISPTVLITVFLNELYNKYFQFTEFKNEKFDKHETNYYLRQKQQIEDFRKIGNKYGTDKIFHEYFNLYGIYLGPIREKNINLLEIGLGCGMFYGAGKSILTWKEYLPKANISILEYNAGCAESFRSQVNNVYIGSQSDFAVLKQLEKSAPYDIIIDDGGHSRLQQINSLLGLFPYIKSGGIYVLEDFYYSFVKDTNDNVKSPYDIVVELIKLFNDPNYVYTPKPDIKLNQIEGFDFTPSSEQIKIFIKSLLSINCFRHACVFVKI